MKIVPSILLLAFAGSLRESECMHAGNSDGASSSGTSSGGEGAVSSPNIVNVMLTGVEPIQGDLVVARKPPPWLFKVPKDDFKEYEMYLHVPLVNNYVSCIPYKLQETPAPFPEKIRVKLLGHKYYSYLRFLKRPPGPLNPELNPLDHIYITIPGTKDVYLQKLITHEALMSMQQDLINARWPGFLKSLRKEGHP